MSVAEIIDTARLRGQMTRPAREATARTERVTLQACDQEIQDELAKPRLPLFEPSRGDEVAALERRRAMVARQLRIVEFSLIEPG